MLLRSPTSLYSKNVLREPVLSESNRETADACLRVLIRKRSTSVGNRKIYLSVGAFVAAAAVAFAVPSVSHAIDLAAITGGALNIASSTNSLLASITDSGFYQAFSLVFLSEIGDKTFFMAGLLAIQTSRLISFLGSMAALAVMTVISVVIGQIFHAVPTGLADGFPLDDIAAVLAFAFFGFKTLKDALDMEEGSSAMNDELAEAEETVEGSGTSKQATAM